MMVLICTTLLAMLTGAFLMASRANSSLSQRSDATLRATQCCYSGLDYVRSRLQNDRSWASGPLGANQVVVNQRNIMRVQESGAGVDENLVSADFPGQDERFQVKLVNNLTQGTAQPAPAFSRRTLAVPRKTALIVVDGYSGSAHRHLEVLLGNDFFTSSPLSSGNDLALTTAPNDPLAHLDFTNPLPELNSVKSRAKTYLPQAQQLTFGLNPNSGIVSGKDDVTLDAQLNVNNANGLLASVPTGGSSMRSATVAQKAAAENQSRATIYPSRDQRAPSLDGDTLRKPSGAAKTLPAGKYVLTGPSKMAYFSNPSANTSADPPDKVYTGAIYDGGAASGTPGDEAVILSDFHFIPRGEVRSSGSVSLEANRPWLTPQLSLGYSAEASLTRGVDAPSSWNVQGNMTIKGNVAGNGSLLAKGSGIIEIQGKTQLAQSPDSGVAIYADQSIRMRPPSPSLLSRSDIFDKNDFAFFSRALVTDTVGGGGPLSDIGNPQHPDQWQTRTPLLSVLARQRIKVGLDDQLFLGGLGTSPVIRDQGLHFSDYRRDVLPHLTGYASGTTPQGRPLTAAESATLQTFLDQCENESGGGAVTIGRHVRIKEFLRSCDRQPGGDANWLTVWPSGHYNDKVQSIVLNLTETLMEESSKYPSTVRLYDIVKDISDHWGDKDLPDVDLRGIAYSGGNFYASTSRSFKLWGAIASHSGSCILEGLHKGDFHFDGDTMENLLDLNKVPLIPVNWAIDN